VSKQAITSRTRVLGVIGDPIEHSLSPLMHNHVLERLGLDYRYVAFHVQQDYGLHVGLAFRTLGLTGLNVTIPYKETVVGQMDVLTEEARIVGAVNTIGMNAKGELVGHNTDVAGFLGALEIHECAGELAARGAVVLGAGGAARAALYALGLSGARPIYLANRTQSRAEALASWFSYIFPDTPVELVPRTDIQSLNKAFDNALITVNVTPLGMAPKVDASPLAEGAQPKAGSVVFDTIYNPECTLLLREAQKAGCRAIGGLDMLIIQGMVSLAWWLRKPIPWKEMMDGIRKRLQAALKK